MTLSVSPNPAPFPVHASINGVFTPEEMDALIERHGAEANEAKVRTGEVDAKVRRSQVAALRPIGADTWVFERIWNTVTALNQRRFNVELHGIEGGIQLARYDASDEGFYNWHQDFSDRTARRKISVSVQLSDPSDYDGGDLEFNCNGNPSPAPRERGSVIAFPSFMLHRVAPVTRGVRYSLVAWTIGPRWR